MTDEEAFLRAIAATPTDHAPRLVYADWLDEHGEPKRAEYLRLLCCEPVPATLDSLRKAAAPIDAVWLTKVNCGFTRVHPEYRVIRRVGGRALTSVYEAANTNLKLQGRLVALRVMNSRQDPARFLHSCHFHAALEHEHIPLLYDVGQVDRPYAARMFVDGDDLMQRMRAGSVSQLDIVKVVTAAASVLDYLRGRETYHGCVDPRHLLSGRDGRDWLIGFGERDAPEETLNHWMSLAPEELGPPPRRIHGPTIDVYQLAESAAWLLGRQHPFICATLEQLLAAKRSEDGWRTGPFRKLPRRVAAVLRRALAPDPAARYPTAGDFAAALADGFDQRPRSRWRFW